MARMTTPSPDPAQEPSASQAAGQPSHVNRGQDGHTALEGWSILPMAVRVDGGAHSGSPRDPAQRNREDDDPQLVPTARGIHSVLGHHRAVAACAEGPSYLQVAVLVDDDGRAAAVAEDGTVVPGDAIGELAATVHRMTGQSLEPVHPHLRRALVLDLDAPELPLLAATARVPFTAVSRDGWSIVVPDDESGWWTLRTGLAQPGVALSSDGAARSLEVLLGDADPAGYTQLDGADAVCGLSWGPQWHAVSAAEDATMGARLTREVLGICGVGTTAVQVESVASVFDLDPVDTKRLGNYVHGDSTPLVLESVLQLLGLPAVAAKIVEGTKDLADLDGVMRVEPGSVPEALAAALVQEPTGQGLGAAAHRAVLRRPELLLAVVGVEIAAGTGLAALARRRGPAATALGALSALAFADAAGLTAWYSAARQRINKNRNKDHGQ